MFNKFIVKAIITELVVWIKYQYLGVIFPCLFISVCDVTEVSTLGTQVAALQAVRLSPRLRNPTYIQWYKDTLKGTLESAEIDGLVDTVVSRTKSPWFEVQITLHILQAQVLAPVLLVLRLCQNID